MNVVCLDLEEVLVPEIWIAFSEYTGIEDLRMTTRDVSDYDVLMKQRLRILKEHSLAISDVHAVVSNLRPFPGAGDIVSWIRERFPFVILSATFYEFSEPLIRQLGWPTLFCHTLKIDQSGFITDYILRQDQAKKNAVKGIQSMNFKVFAAGDSHNDIGMLSAADYSTFINAPDSIKKQYPEFDAVDGFSQLKEKLSEVCIAAS